MATLTIPDHVLARAAEVYAEMTEARGAYLASDPDARGVPQLRDRLDRAEGAAHGSLAILLSYVPGAARAAIKESPEMARARKALAAATGARHAVLSADPHCPEAEDRRLKGNLHTAEFECELALASLVSLVDYVVDAGGAS